MSEAKQKLWSKINTACSPTVLVFYSERVPSKLKATDVILRQWAMQTQPLSECMLLACAYQSARQRNMGIPKKACQGFGQLFGKGRLFGRPFFKTNPQELSTLCIYPENSWTTQRMCQTKKTVYHKSCPNMFILQLWRNIPLTTMTSIELRLLNTCCITQKVRCWGGNNQKDIAKEQGHGRKTYKVFSLNPFY